MKAWIGVVLRGAIIWLVPLVVSFGFYTPTLELVTSYALFKSVMVVVLTGTLLLVNLVRPPLGVAPWVAALVYLVVNLALDVLVVVPMARLTVGAYIEQIALVYVIIPALTWAMLSRRAPVAVAAGG
jgi:uncharacterized membrane protein YuzA (DUF378 family)